MTDLRNTISFCPECYKQIPASVFIEKGSVMMKKECSEHGEFEAMVERDADFYAQCLMANAPTIYGGHFIDVTEKCNLQCEYCYFPVKNKSSDRSIQNIVQEIVLNPTAERIILTGGEPTLRKDLLDIINVIQAVKPVELLTNGCFIDQAVFDELNQLLTAGDTMRLNLSLHDEAYDDYMQVLELFRKNKLRIESVLRVIDHVDQIQGFIEFCEQWKDVICATRIKAATPIWNDQKTDARIFVSDMLAVLIRLGAKMVWWRNNKVSFVTVELNGIFHMLVSWYDVRNIDLLDISCPPTYTAKTGGVHNIVTSMIINEGIKKRILNGVEL